VIVPPPEPVYYGLVRRTEVVVVAPLIPIVLIGTGAISGIGGGVSAIRGAQKMKQARREAGRVEAEYNAELSTTKQAVEATNIAVHDFGVFQEEALVAVVHRMADFLRRHEQAVAERASELLDGVVVDTQRLEKFTGGRLTPEGLATHIASAAGAGAATYTSIPIAVATYGSASTGTAITNLSGIAARNATLAWLGGGSLASGGGGMALGAMALNVVTIGPTILIGGLVLNGKGEKALTEARRYRVSVDKSISDQHQLRNRLEVIGRRIDELDDLLTELTTRAATALDELESNEPFDPDEHAEVFSRALAYAIAVRDVVSTPLLDSDGELAADTDRLLVTYRGMQ
jgi:hypothetical protein